MIKTLANAGNQKNWKKFRRDVADAHGSTEPPEVAWRNGVDRKLEHGAHRTELLEQRQQLTDKRHAEDLLALHEKIGTLQIQTESAAKLAATKEDIKSLMQLQWAMAGSFLLGLLTVIIYAATQK